MEQPSQTINLFESTSGLSPIIPVIAKYLRIVSFVFIGVLILGGVFVGFWLTTLNRTEETLNNQKETYTKDIESQQTKEFMLSETKVRLTAIEKIQKTLASYTPFLDTTMKIVQVPELTSFVLGPQGTVILTIETSSIDKALKIISSIFSLVSEKKIYNPVLEALVIKPNGSVQMNISYKVILSSS